MEGLSDSAYAHLITLKQGAPYLDSLSKQCDLQFWLNAESALIFIALAIICSIIIATLAYRHHKEKHLLLIDCLIKEIQKVFPRNYHHQNN